MAKQSQKKQGDPGTLPVPETGLAAPLVSDIRVGVSTPASIKPPEAQEPEDSAIVGYRWKFAEETHQYLREQIRLSDQKAGFFFAVATALIAFLYRENLLDVWLKKPDDWRFSDMLSCVSTLGLSLSALCCARTVFPRLPGSKRDILYFGGISEFPTGTDYASEVSKHSPNELIHAKLSHAHVLARICNGKYTCLRFGLLIGLFGLIATVLLLFCRN